MPCRFPSSLPSPSTGRPKVLSRRRNEAACLLCHVIIDRTSTQREKGESAQHSEKASCFAIRLLICFPLDLRDPKCNAAEKKTASSV